MRRLVLVLAAIGTLAEALLLAGVLFVLGQVIGAYSMSMNGADPGTAQIALRVLAVIIGLSLAVLAVLLVVAAVRNGPIRGATRVLVIGALVIQWVIAVIVGVTMRGLEFALVLAIFGCLLGVLLMESPRGELRGTPR